jgi:hypothetical protein
MHIIVDRRIPEPALEKLAETGNLIPFPSEGIAYPSISGHPDIFICKTPQGIVVAPNAPSETIQRISNLGIALIQGEQDVGTVYPLSARYNAFVNASYYIHNTRHTDPAIKHCCKSLICINVRQAYTRCNLTEAGGIYITSDRSIEKVLLQHQLEVLYINPRQIILPGHDHGFFGGCTGIYGNTLYLIGSHKFFDQGNELKTKLTERGIGLVDLYHGPLYDGGSIIFL